MLTYNLYNKILIEPVLENSRATRLQIIAGYASPYMVKMHIQKLASLKLNRPIHIELIIGMSRSINKKEHLEFCKLTKTSGTNTSISCKYMVRKKQVHAKTYCWLSSDNEPLIAFAGSANYTAVGFGLNKKIKQTETMICTDTQSAKNLYDRLEKYTIDCADYKMARGIKLYKTNNMDWATNWIMAAIFLLIVLGIIFFK